MCPQHKSSISSLWRVFSFRGIGPNNLKIKELSSCIRHCCCANYHLCYMTVKLGLRSTQMWFLLVFGLSKSPIYLWWSALWNNLYLLLSLKLLLYWKLGRKLLLLQKMLDLSTSCLLKQRCDSNNQTTHATPVVLPT